MSTELTLVTVCRDNPLELVATLASVFFQSIKPFRHLVIDSSQPDKSGLARDASVFFGAEYLWVEPEGTYAAMAHGLADIDGEQLVWFLNASDSLATRNSLKEVLTFCEKLIRQGVDVAWVTGRTVARRGDLFWEKPFSRATAAYLGIFLDGKAGFPHSSTVMRAKDLREVEAFVGRTNVAEDYRIGVALCKQGIFPLMLDNVLSFYNTEGQSGKKPIRTYFAKLAIRVKYFGLSELQKEPRRAFLALVRATLRDLRKRFSPRLLVGNMTNLREKSSLPEGAHFCNEPGGRWPACCVGYLDEFAVEFFGKEF